MEEIQLSLNAQRLLEAHTYALEMHSNALACHAECLGMNAANSLAICKGFPTIPFEEIDYNRVLAKWNVMSIEGKPLI